MSNRAGINPSEPLHVRLHNRQFSIKLIPPPPEERNLFGWRLVFLITSMILVFLSVMGFLIFILPKDTVLIQKDLPNISLIYTAPRYLAVNDENIVEITLLNLDTTKSFNGTVTLVFSNSDISVSSTSDQRMSIFIGGLLPSDRITRQLKVKLSKKPIIDYLPFHFQITLTDMTQYQTPDGKFLVSPISGIRSIWSWITGGSGLIGLMVTFIFERFKVVIGVQK